MTPDDKTTDDDRNQMAERLVENTVTAMELLSVHLGRELGLYQAIRDTGGTEADMASRAGVAPRYAREWLEQQTVAGIVTCDDPARPAPERVYRLPAGHAEVLLDADSLYYSGPLTAMLAGIARVLPLLPDAYRTGGGVPYAAFGAEIRQGIADLNRPAFQHDLAAAWLPTMPDVVARLGAAPAARVLDLGCGEGNSTIALARGYPENSGSGC